MKVRAAAGVIIALCAWAPLRAHRLDEYLQAAQIDISPISITVDLYLTPGVIVAPAVLEVIDVDHDDAVSASEAERYAHAVLAGVALSVDGRPQALTLVSCLSAPAEAMRRGEGTMHISARSDLPGQSKGRHALVFENHFQPQMSVYLVNAMLPQSAAVAVRSQERDARQNRSDIVYDLNEETVRPAVIAWLLVGLMGLAGSFLFARRWMRRSIAPLS